MAVQALDLTKVPPRRAREELGGYVYLARLADIVRAVHAGTNGDYLAYDHVTMSWLEHLVLSKGHFDAVVRNGADDNFLVMFLNRHVDNYRQEQVNKYMLQERAADFDKQDAAEGYA